MSDEKSIFEKLFAIDVSRYTDERKNLTYLSWSHALSETMKIYPEMNYDVERFGENRVPYLYDPMTGYMVFTSVTIEGMTKKMWLPVLDTNNKAMLDKPYTYDTKSQKGIVVAAATVYDINKAIMRCLVKNLAAFGLGLYIYNKDDLPEAVTEETERAEKELSEAKAKIMDLGTAAIKVGMKKEQLYAIIAEFDNGNKNPNDIADIEIANKIIKRLTEETEQKSDEAPQKPAKTTAKKKNEEAGE